MKYVTLKTRILSVLPAVAMMIIGSKSGDIRTWGLITLAYLFIVDFAFKKLYSNKTEK